MRTNLLMPALLLALGLVTPGRAEEPDVIRDENEGYRRVEDQNIRMTAPATVDAAVPGIMAAAPVNAEMDVLKDGFEQRRSALLGVIRSTTDKAVINRTEIQLEQLRQEQNLAEYTLLLRQAEQAGRADRAAELREVIRQETAPVPPAVQSERVLSHEEKLGLQEARGNHK
jgi:hypothetical protein